MTVEELNAHIESNSINEVIEVAEARQRKALSRIADDICARAGKRLALVAGGSSAGKTTTAKRLCTQLKVNERAALALSTDDYFVGDAKNPRKPDGSFDYEHVACVDIARLSADINALLSGEAVPRRRFDFLNHVPTYDDGFHVLPAEGIIVLEGIHALNPCLTVGVDDAAKYRVNIDPRPTLDLGGGAFPTSADARFLRRLVRDNQFRKMSPSVTVKIWPSVLAGEAKWIDPFRAGAEATFDSYLVYELAVLKFYAGGLLARARRELGDAPDVMRAIGFLEAVTPVDATRVPGDSILRETIGGSQLEY